MTKKFTYIKTVDTGNNIIHRAKERNVHWQNFSNITVMKNTLHKNLQWVFTEDRT